MTRELTPTPVGAAQGQGLVAALTFDDGPNGADTAELLDFLESRGIRAVFAVVGQRVLDPGGAELLKRIVDEGHVLCNHSRFHHDMGGWDADSVREDLQQTLDIIRSVVPHAEVPFWRAPNGSWGVSCDVAVELGMQPLDVINVIGDWAEQDADVLEARLWEVLTREQIILCHDGGGDRSGTVAAIKRFVDEAVSDGWEFTLPVGSA
ncbi:polysaccharide deacetylase family protein [Demequina sp.]|uniref:polysaccharide deacetylase family protein n=1 Tax=Demequina sp. TaxID=2050685 RepID=UPI003D0C2EFF